MFGAPGQAHQGAVRERDRADVAAGRRQFREAGMSLDELTES